MTDIAHIPARLKLADKIRVSVVGTTTFGETAQWSSRTPAVDGLPPTDDPFANTPASVIVHVVAGCAK
jgi:hypothetical protein